MKYERLSRLLWIAAILGVVHWFTGCRVEMCRSPEENQRYLTENWELLHELAAMWREDAPRGMTRFFQGGPHYKPWIADGGTAPAQQRLDRYQALMRDANVCGLRGSAEYLQIHLYPPGLKRYVPGAGLVYRWCGFLLLLEPGSQDLYTADNLREGTKCTIGDTDFENWKTIDCRSI